jgi:hypothetical protein
MSFVATFPIYVYSVPQQCDVKVVTDYVEVKYVKDDILIIRRGSGVPKESVSGRADVMVGIDEWGRIVNIEIDFAEEGQMVSCGYMPSLRYQIATTVAAAVSGLMIIYAVFSLFSNYSEVRFIYYVLAVLSFAVADLFADMRRVIGALALYATSALLALKAAL